MLGQTSLLMATLETNKGKAVGVWLGLYDGLAKEDDDLGNSYF